MKTIYLCCESIECLIADIQRVFPEYQGETDYSIEGGGIHIIGDIVLTTDEEGNPLTWVGKQHANIYAPDEIDESIFETRMLEVPEKPVNKLAL